MRGKYYLLCLLLLLLVFSLPIYGDQHQEIYKSTSIEPNQQREKPEPSKKNQSESWGIFDELTNNLKENLQKLKLHIKKLESSLNNQLIISDQQTARLTQLSEQLTQSKNYLKSLESKIELAQFKRAEAEAARREVDHRIGELKSQRNWSIIGAIISTILAIIGWIV